VSELNAEPIRVLIDNSASWVVGISNSAGWLINGSISSITHHVNPGTGGVDLGKVHNGSFSTVDVGVAAYGIRADRIAQVTQIGKYTLALFGSDGAMYVDPGTGGMVGITNTAGWIVYTIDSRPTGTAITTVASTVGTVVLSALNANRRTFSAYNNSTNPLFLKLGSGAKTTDFTLMMVGSGYYELQNPVYTGVITGVWGTANGGVQITEGT
jgi:hypothetical protein